MCLKNIDYHIQNRLMDQQSCPGNLRQLSAPLYKRERAHPIYSKRNGRDVKRPTTDRLAETDSQWSPHNIAKQEETRAQSNGRT